jgi:hypothetical protein
VEISKKSVRLAFIDSFLPIISPKWRIANGGNKRLQEMNVIKSSINVEV